MNCKKNAFLLEKKEKRMKERKEKKRLQAPRQSSLDDTDHNSFVNALPIVATNVRSIVSWDMIHWQLCK